MSTSESILSAVLASYGIAYDGATITAYGKGLINSTWKVRSGQGDYILQKINGSVFANPGDIAFNIRVVSDYLHQHYPAYTFVAPVLSLGKEDLVELNGEGAFRLFPFVPGSYTHEVVGTAGEAYEAALQFGRFTALLSDFDAGVLKTTIPFFHDLSLRHTQFQNALSSAKQERLEEAGALIESAHSYSGIVTDYQQIQKDARFKTRVTHHDTKISNVLFDKNNHGICVIDLDTVMPGYFISDVGDMMRTYLSPVSEEEQDYGKIVVRDEFYKAIVSGYRKEMQPYLTDAENRHFFYAGKFMIYMQGLRFLTDYLNHDVYYGAAYKGHNLVRAGNQFYLLERFLEKETLLSA